MNIALDISQIIHKGTGVSRFTEGLANAILKYDKDNHWTFFFSSLRKDLDKELIKKIKSKGHKLIRYKIPPTLLSFIWNKVHTFKIDSIVGKQDWIITSDWTEPPSDSKKATIVHDLVYLRYPKTVHKKILTTQKIRLNWVREESDLIFADSIATKEDLQTSLNIPEEKIKVIYPGVEIEKASKDQSESTLKKYNLKKEYILTVGKIEPRKNLKRLIEAFNSLKNNNIQLVVVGPSGWEEIKDISRNVLFLGFVSDTELSALYQNCLFFVFPSIWEGFGYPLVEAMAHGRSTAVSKNSSLYEIGKDSSLFFDPFNVESIKEVLLSLSANTNLRSELSKKGVQKSKIFTWENYYRSLIVSLKNNL